MNTEKFQVNLGEGQNELIIREGKAQNILDVKPPVKIDLSGNIDSPYQFLSKRFEHSKDANLNEETPRIFNHFDHTRCHVIVNREQVAITLVIDEHDEYNRGTVKGSLALNPKFVEFGINSQKGWDPNELGQFFKMNRAYFPDKSKNMKLVSDLKNFVADVNNTIEKQREDKGSFKDNYSAVVTSNLPESFTLEIPVFKGYQKEMIEVEFYATVSGRDVELSLISPSATELYESLRDNCIDEQILKIKEVAPEIVIIEQ